MSADVKGTPGRAGTVEVLGLRFQPMTRREAAAVVAQMVESGTRGYVVKPYSEFMPRAVRDPEIQEVLSKAALCLADGTGILWAAHYLSLPGGRVRALMQLPLSLAAIAANPRAIRGPLPEAMAGVDFTWEMLEALDGIDARVYLLGGREDEVRGARRRIEERFRGLKVVGARNGYFEAQGKENERVVADVYAAEPQVLLVAMGFPRQELWIAESMPRLEATVAVAEGGSFSFISGTAARAPSWMRKAGLEWLYRVVRQPWRIRRQLALPQFVWLVLQERLRAAKG